MKLKFVFVLIVGIVLAFIVIKSFFGNSDEDQKDDFNFTEDEYFIGTQNFDSTDSSLMDEDEEIETEKKDDIEEEPDYEQQYKDNFGINSFERAKEIAQEIVIMFLEEEGNKTKWKQYSTSSFFDEIQKEFVEYSDGVKREVRNLETHAASPNEKNEMRFGVLADYLIVNDETVISQQTKLFYVILTASFDEREWVVKELVEV